MVLETHDLVQHVGVPTHVNGHTLDLLISRKDDSLINLLSTYGDLPSDHRAINVLLDISRPPPTIKQINCRNIKAIDMDSLRQNINESPLLRQPADGADNLVNQYRSVLQDIIDDHAPLVCRNIILRPHAPQAELDPSLPDHTDAGDLANRFMDFYQQSIGLRVSYDHHPRTSLLLHLTRSLAFTVNELKR